MSKNTKPSEREAEWTWENVQTSTERPPAVEIRSRQKELAASLPDCFFSEPLGKERDVWYWLWEDRHEEYTTEMRIDYFELYLREIGSPEILKELKTAVKLVGDNVDRFALSRQDFAEASGSLRLLEHRVDNLVECGELAVEELRKLGWKFKDDFKNRFRANDGSELVSISSGHRPRRRVTDLILDAYDEIQPAAENAKKVTQKNTAFVREKISRRLSRETYLSPKTLDPGIHGVIWATIKNHRQD